MTQGRGQKNGTTGGNGLSRLCLLALASVIALMLSACAQGIATADGSGEGRPGSGSGVRSLTPKEALLFIEQNKGKSSFMLLDIRTPEEFATGHIDGAVNINYNGDDFVSRLDALDKQRTYMVYCRTGRRSSDAVRIMTRLGFTTIIRISGDIVRWKAEGLPVKVTQ